jgi:hypothetical protein
LEDLLSPDTLKVSGFFDPDFVAKILREHKEGVREHAFRIWTIVVFQAWYRTYMEKRWPKPRPDSIQAAARGTEGTQSRIEVLQ